MPADVRNLALCAVENVMFLSPSDLCTLTGYQ